MDQLAEDMEDILIATPEARERLLELVYIDMEKGADSFWMVWHCTSGDSTRNQLAAEQLAVVAKLFWCSGQFQTLRTAM